MGRKVILGIAAVAAVAVAGGAYWAYRVTAEPAVVGGPPLARLISNDQYRHAIADVFGADIAIPVSFPPVQRTEGLVALGAAAAQVTPSAAELYDQSARAIAAQVIDANRRDYLLNCAPAAAPDEACAKNIMSRYGRLLFRRSLSESELAQVLARHAETVASSNNFYQGIASGLSSLLIAPQFLFLIEGTEPDPASPNSVRLNGSSIATRLSLLLWDMPPDETLLDAAEAGELHTKKGLERQVARLLSSPRLEQGVRAFFTDMLVFEKYETLAKDPVIYPAFTEKVAVDSREQTLRTLVDHLVVRDEDYRDIFTTRRTFMSGDLGMVYRIPVERPHDWNAYEFPADSGRAGILTQLSFLALYSHPGRSSPTVRGKAIREVFLCQLVPRPPPDVDFSGFEDPNGHAKTARERLTAHRKDPVCAGCHKITDPIGLALENFDGSGFFRTTENGVPIDASGELGATTFQDPVGLGQAMRNDPAATSCVANRLLDYGRGYKTTPSDAPWLAALNQKFADGQYRFSGLLKAIATSKAFYAVSPPVQGAAPAQTAAIQ